MSNARALSDHFTRFDTIKRFIPYSLWSAIEAGTSTVDITSYFQDAIDELNSLGGGKLYLPAGLYRVQNVLCKDKIAVIGVRGGTTLKVVDGVDKQIFLNANQAAGTPINYWGMEDLILDGNVSGSPKAVAASAVAINVVNHFYAKRCVFQNASGYGLAFQAQDNTSIPGQQKLIYLESCEFNDNGPGIGGGADTYDGIDIKDCERLVMIDCHANRNNDRGFNIRGQFVTLIGCTAEGNGFNGQATAPTPGKTGGFEMVANVNTTRRTTLRMISCEAYNNSGPGFNVSNGTGSPATDGWVRVQMSACTAEQNGTSGVELLGASDKVEFVCDGLISVENGTHGVDIGSSVLSAKISGTIKSNGGSGIRTAMSKLRVSDCDIQGNTSYGIEETASATRTIVSGSTIVTGNTAGNFLWNANGRRVVSPTVTDYDIGSGDIIASAGTITVPEGGNGFYVTGTTQIDTVTASRRGRIITLAFSASLTVKDGTGNLLLSADFPATSGDTLTLMCDGTNWQEMSRSAN